MEAMTDDRLAAKLARINELMNNVSPGSPEEAEYLALIAEVQAEEDQRWLKVSGEMSDVG